MWHVIRTGRLLGLILLVAGIGSAGEGPTPQFEPLGPVSGKLPVALYRAHHSRNFRVIPK